MDEYNGRELPKALCTLIRRLSIIKVGNYNGNTHCFQTPILDPNENAISEMRKEYLSHPELSPDDFGAVLGEVLKNTSVTPTVQEPAALDMKGDNQLEPLSHVVLKEEYGDTVLLYLGDARFYVLSTNRSTILPGDIIESRPSPLKVHDRLNFNVYRNGKRFKPEGQKDFDSAFNPKNEIVSLLLYSAPDLYSIIDKDSRFGGMLHKLGSDVEAGVLKIVSLIKKHLSEWETAHPGQKELPEIGYYPDYDVLLAEAMKLGIPTYVLNLIIETCEKREETVYTYVESDWEQNLTPEQVVEIERKRVAKGNKELKDLRAALNAELQNVTRRRVALFFDAPGRITPESQNYLDELAAKLDKLAIEGFGTKGYAQKKIAEAKANSKPRPGHNLKAGAILAAVVAAAIFVAYSIMTAKKSNEVFETAITEMEELVEDGQFKEGEAHMAEAFSAYKPAYLQFTKKRSLRACNSYINRAIDEFVDERVEQISSFIQANYGRIDDFTWDLIKECMEFRPDDERLLEFRERYIAQ